MSAAIKFVYEKIERVYGNHQGPILNSYGSGPEVEVLEIRTISKFERFRNCTIRIGYIGDEE